MKPHKINRLVVEDKDIKGVTISLLRHRLHWGESEDEHPVTISGGKGKNTAIKEVPVELKGSDVKRVGLVVDADDSPQATWDAISRLCRKFGKQVPAACPKGGLILDLEGQRFGAWIMPNNADVGMVENLCFGLVPDSTKDLWNFALECAQNALENHAAPFPPNYLAKAQMHTWLAWQPRPGEQMGIAIKNKALGHRSKDADAFSKWFIELFELQGWPAAT